MVRCKHFSVFKTRNYPASAAFMLSAHSSFGLANRATRGAHATRRNVDKFFASYMWSIKLHQHRQQGVCWLKRAGQSRRAYFLVSYITLGGPF